ncbi:MAG: FxLYD domain-containing protein [Bacilli bacterium]|nr:FxLYD domain-containing protein [Bacilli bacterium]
MSKLLYNIKQNKKVVLVVLLVIIIIGVVLFSIPKVKKNMVKLEDNGIYAHTEEGIIKEEEYDGIKFSNISMLTKDGYTTFTSDITNTSDSDIEKERLHIILKDENDKEALKYLAYFPGGLKKGETKTITATAHGNFTNVKTKIITD